MEFDRISESDVIAAMKDQKIHAVFCKKAYFITIDGRGHPEVAGEYMRARACLHAVFSHLQKICRTKDILLAESPLHMLWWADRNNPLDDKRNLEWHWRTMLEISEHITEMDIEAAKRAVYESCGESLGLLVVEREMNESHCLQMLHSGDSHEERRAWDQLYDAAERAMYPIKGKRHAIYFNYPKTTAQASMKTILRLSVDCASDEILDFVREKALVFEKIGVRNTMVLSTIHRSQVSSRMMCVVTDRGKLYMQTALEFRKCKDMELNSNVALCLQNIQIEGKVTDRFSWYDRRAETFRRLYQTHHPGSAMAYSKLMGNRIFEIEPTYMEMYCYEGKDVYLKFIDIISKRAWKKWYMMH